MLERAIATSGVRALWPSSPYLGGESALESKLAAIFAKFSKLSKTRDVRTVPESIHTGGDNWPTKRFHDIVFMGSHQSTKWIPHESDSDLDAIIGYRIDNHSQNGMVEVMHVDDKATETTSRQFDNVLQRHLLNITSDSFRPCKSPNERRIELIRKKIYDNLQPNEVAELAELQRQDEQVMKEEMSPLLAQLKLMKSELLDE